MAERENFNSVLRITLNEAAKLTLVGNAIQMPFVQDPLGLTQAQLAANPQQAGSGATIGTASGSARRTNFSRIVRRRKKRAGS